jgi:hypothetical protein
MSILVLLLILAVIAGLLHPLALSPGISGLAVAIVIGIYLSLRKRGRGK